jgi:hypothetical protein
MYGGRVKLRGLREVLVIAVLPRDKAGYILIGQDYVVVQRTATTLTVEQEGCEGVAEQETVP